jgi:hypothetical protein
MHKHAYDLSFYSSLICDKSGTSVTNKVRISFTNSGHYLKVRTLLQGCSLKPLFYLYSK